MNVVSLFGAAVVGALTGALVTYLGLREFGIRAANSYDCTAPATIVLKKQLLGMPHYLELYAAGWIDRGSVTIKGVPSRRSSNLNEITFSANSEISHSYVGEWYLDDVVIEFQPTEDARCHIRVRYRLR